MFNFGPSNPGLADDNLEWEQYHGEAENNAHRRWQQREQRARYDEANRYNREEAVSQGQYMAGQAGLFENMDDTMSQLSRNRITPASATRPANTLAGGPMNLQPGTPQPAAAPTPTTQPPATMQSGSRPGEVDIHADTGAIEAGENVQPLELQGRNPSQQSAISAYRNRVNGIRNRQHGTEPLRRAIGVLVTTGVMSQAQANAEYSRVLRAVGQDTRPNVLDVTDRAQVNVAERFGLAPEEDVEDTSGDVAGSGTATDTATDELDPYYQGNNDTSRGLRPTREMRLLEANVRNNMRRADLAARHGRNDIATEAFALAMQGQLAYIQQGYTSLYRSAALGNLDAAGELAAAINGYPEGTVRFRPTDEEQARLIMEVDTGDGNWVAASEAPMQREQMLAGFQRVLDAEGAQAQAEINAENLNSLRENQRHITVATIEQRTAILRMATEAATARMQEDGRQDRHYSDAQVVMNNDTNTAYIIHPDDTIETVSMEDVRVPGTNGNETEQRAVRRRVGGGRVSAQPNVGLNDE